MVEYKVHKLWSWLPPAGVTLGKHIFLKDVQDKLTLEHELVHVEQQMGHGFFGFLWWWFTYLFFPLPMFWNPWRTRYEAEAYATQAKAGCPIEGDHGLAACLSGSMYGWCCRRSRAEQAIKAWL